MTTRHNDLHIVTVALVISVYVRLVVNAEHHPFSLLGCVCSRRSCINVTLLSLTTTTNSTYPEISIHFSQHSTVLLG